ncbi:hypothetical protein Goshw_022485 [Gossypium schwendimanii]|uniref:RNase H type-1 domain-containing protein n=1 Tax=Gossypium schwendimanii TaxID=34291 RepID=A0A7J9M631_GOSSC|nr:hypothetical protein [Gossypium schwendimanii]
MIFWHGAVSLWESIQYATPINYYKALKKILERMLYKPTIRTLHSSVGFFVEFYGQYGEKGTLECIESKWKHPPDQFVKINFDAAYDGRFFHSALGIVVRNSEGKVLLACSEIH